MESVVAWIEFNFPNLQGKHGTAYEVTSPNTKNYNCIAWAANDTEKWWWPDTFSYWPKDLPQIVTIENFVAAFNQLGYKVTETAALEPDHDKVALYAIAEKPTHMARQLESGVWTSKLGPGHDISHRSLSDVEGNIYGEVVRILKRPRSV